MGTWIYVKSEPQLYTVGFYSPEGEWHAESDWDTRQAAAARVHYLNGGTDDERIERILESLGFLLDGYTINAKRAYEGEEAITDESGDYI